MDLEDLKPQDLAQVVNLYGECIGDAMTFKQRVRRSPQGALIFLLEFNKPIKLNNGDSMEIAYVPLEGFKVKLTPNEGPRRDIGYFKHLEQVKEFERIATNYLRRRYGDYELPIDILDSEAC
jgi:hypothetical protein